PRPATWPLPTGLGGTAGDFALAASKLFALLLPASAASLLAGALLLVAGGAGVLYASAIPLNALRALLGEEDEDVLERPRDGAAAEEDAEEADGEEDAWHEALMLRLGAAAHWLLSVPALLARLTGRRALEIPSPFEEHYEAEGEAGLAGPVAGPQQAVDEEGRIEPFFETAPAGVAEPDAPDAGSEKHYRITPRADMQQPQGKSRQIKRLAGVASTYALPPLRLLKNVPANRRGPGLSEKVLQENARQLEEVLQDFGVKGEIVNVRPGPVVTLYELEPAPGTKSSRVIGLADDIARSMSAASARVAVVQGRNAIGIELPNARREVVYLRELLEDEGYQKSEAGLPLALGKNIGGEPVIVDLARMPHLLIAGTTGSGKSVGINTMILSLLYRFNPDECKFIMIDPKMLELSIYDGIPHLLAPVVTDPKKAVVALKWTVREMEERYKRMSKLGVRNIDGYNERVVEAQARGEVITRTIQTGFDKETGEAIYEEEQMDYDPMPYIVVIVDEMADLMMVAGKDIEGAVQRLAQMARAAGIHLITATQRPSVDVVTGTIKANFPTRISFQVTSKIDSRTILGEQGAEQLLGQGDMLYMAGGGRITRLHGPFVSDEEVEKSVRYLKRQGAPEYLESITQEDEEGGAAPGGAEGGEETSLYDQAVAIVLRDGKASTSYIQRRLSIGYNRAATLIEQMEEQGVIGPADHAGKREILVGEGAGEQPY
ncbi:MAG: DNA translocase FtsK, partial [Alphaproteobacteria bacterium]